MKNHRVELFVIGENPLQKRKLAEKHQRQLESNKQLSESLVTTSTSKPLNDMEYPTNDRLDKVGSLNVNHESMKESLNTDNEAKKDTVNTNSEIVKDAPMLDDNPTGNLAISSTSDKDGKISREMFEFTEMCEETEDVVDSQPPEKRARVCDSDRLQDQSVNVNNCTESMLTECSGSDLEKTKDSTEEIDNENLELEIIDQDEAVNVNNCTESMLTESNGSDLEKTKDSTKEIDNGNLELEIIDQEKVHRATNTEQSTSDNNGSKSIEETSDTSLSNALISNSNEVSDLGLEIIDKEKVHRATNTEQSTSDNNNSKSIEETSDTSLSNAPVSNSNEVSDISNSNEVSDILNSNEVSDLGLAGGQPKVAVVEDYNEEKMYDLIDVGCDNCSVSYKDPTSAELLMFLHAYRYKVSVIQIKSVYSTDILGNPGVIHSVPTAFRNATVIHSVPTAFRNPDVIHSLLTAFCNPGVIHSIPTAYGMDHAWVTEQGFYLGFWEATFSFTFGKKYHTNWENNY